MGNHNVTDLSIGTSAEQQLFLFERPDYGDKISPLANIALSMGAMASRLVQVERQDTIHPDGRRENDAEHSFMLAKVAPEIVRALYPDMDDNLVARFANLHDDPEAYVGDTPTRIITPEGLLAKKILEAGGVKRLVTEYAHVPRYTQLMQDYEEQIIPEARVVRLIDKIMTQLIHFPNEGLTLRRLYTRQNLLQQGRVTAAKLLAEFPEFPEIIELRLELDQLLVDEFFPVEAE